jgi:protoporphyrinogen oxidase
VTTFVVIGGGVSGLAAARILAGCKPVSEAGGTGLGGDAEVLLLESSDRVGGKLLTGAIRVPRTSAGTSGSATT